MRALLGLLERRVPTTAHLARRHLHSSRPALAPYVYHKLGVVAAKEDKSTVDVVLEEGLKSRERLTAEGRVPFRVSWAGSVFGLPLFFGNRERNVFFQYFEAPPQNSDQVIMNF